MVNRFEESILWELLGEDVCIVVLGPAVRDRYYVSLDQSTYFVQLDIEVLGF